MLTLRHRLARFCCASLLLATLGLTSAAIADEVLLTDGSKLVGKVQDLDKDGLGLKTDFAGLIRIAPAKIKGINTDARVTLALATGDRAAGILKYTDAGQVRTGTVFGDVPVKLAAVQGLWGAEVVPPVAAPGAAPAAAAAPAGADVQQLQKQHAAELAAVKADADTKVAAAEAAYLKSQAVWKASVELGLNGQTGNTELFNFNGRAEAKRTTSDTRFLTFIEGHYSRNNGLRTTNQVLGGAGVEIDLSPRVFTFGKVSLEYNEQEDLDIRAIVSGGVGYFFIKEPGQELKGRVGAGYQHQSFNDGTNTNDPILELGYDYSKDITTWLLFTHSGTYYPSLNAPAKDYRLVFETAGVIPLSPDKAWKVKAGMRNQYNSTPRPGIERLDTYYFLNLVYDFVR